MRDTSPIETRELSDADLDSVSGGLSVGGSVEGLKATFEPGPNGLPVLKGGSVDSVSIDVSDIPLGPAAG
ncbi:hypothetical protein GCM10012287_56700 [Streptomyces daqingensis]|uniref:Type A2 lantipeptide n=1 Tax=Streptomyces daqingensis TaxID=1472640 RepID=A0ABQ2MW06_9ACTN|nr:hypothetical protein [Streptomyces daqingensis]GGO58470.1 hypothetical protein GCM10012287_56700 [Streptomyces daqingensis]